LSESWEPRIVAFVCNWCTYVGADLAGTSRRTYAPNVRIIRLPCSGRIDPRFIVRALEQGADGVLVSGCHPGDCHYTKGNYYARRRYLVFNSLLNLLGLEPDRVRFAWVSAAEGNKWAELVNLTVDAVRALGPLKLYAEPSEAAPVLQSSSEQTAGGMPAIDTELAERGVRQAARELLEGGDAELVIGYVQTPNGTVVPGFVSTPAEAERLVWNDRCVHNLTTYLTGERIGANGKVAVVVKGCDARAAVALMQESQLDRQRVKLIGVECHGVRGECGQLADKCGACELHTPHICDVLASADGAVSRPEAPGTEPTSFPASQRVKAELAELMAMSPAQRLAFWRAELSRCVRCYACRAVCPLCYCQICAADRNQPQYLAPGSDWKGALSWEVTRALHLAGRCVGCGECVRACPQGIRLDLIQSFLADVVQRELGSVSGADPQALPPLSTFRPEDPEEFIL